MADKRCKVVLLAGGVGGAKMAEGLDGLDDIDLAIIGNVADDAEFHGLWVSPDIDTVTYTLADRIDRKQGWGVADESHRALSVLAELGKDAWMTLGDRDFGLHIYRTERIRNGDRRSEIAADVAKAFGVKSRILLPTDDIIQTQIKTDAGWMSFQEYFVREACRPEVQDIRFEGAEKAQATPEALAAIDEAELIVIAPSNPLVSIAPILSVSGLKEALQAAAAPKIAVSPIIAGKVVKGPADRMMASLGLEATALGVARHYADLADAIIIDRQDAALEEPVEALGLRCIVDDILMKNREDKTRLARLVVDCAALPGSRRACA